MRMQHSPSPMNTVVRRGEGAARVLFSGVPRSAAPWLRELRTIGGPRDRSASRLRLNLPVH
jgi:hypothetical protein